jgi:hypothetical protein
MIYFYSRRYLPDKTFAVWYKRFFPTWWKRVLGRIRGCIEGWFLPGEVQVPRKRGVNGMEQRKWIAVDVDTDEVVARGDTIADAAEKAKEKGVENPMVTRAVEEGQDMFF